MTNVKNTITLEDKFSATLNKVNKSMHTTLNIMKRLDKNMGMPKMAREFVKTEVAVQKYSRGLDNVTKSSKQTKGALDQVKNSLAANFAVGNLASMAVWRLLGAFKETIVGGINYASNMVEVQNVVDVAYGKNAGTANKWAKSALKSYGMNELSAKKYIGTLSAQIQASGLAGKAAGTMAVDLTGLAGDLASFYNLPIDQAFNKIRSGMSGTVMPLRQLGIDMTVATLSAHALTMGINEKWKKLNQVQKTLIRYNYLMKITGKQQGDFEKTFYSFANQQRYSTELWNQNSGAIAKNFLPVLTVSLIVMNKMQQGFLNLGVAIKNNQAIMVGLGYTVAYLGTLFVINNRKIIVSLMDTIRYFIITEIAAAKAGQSMVVAWGKAVLPALVVIGILTAVTMQLYKMGFTMDGLSQRVVGGFYMMGASVSNFAKRAISFIDPVVKIIQSLYLGILKSIDAMQGSNFAQGAQKQIDSYNKWKSNLKLEDPNKAYKKGVAKGHDIAVKTKSMVKSITSIPNFNQKITEDKARNQPSGSPSGAKNDPIHTKIDKDDISLLVEIAKTQYINKFTSMQPILQATFGDVHQNADVRGIMGELVKSMNEAQASSLSSGVK